MLSAGCLPCLKLASRVGVSVSPEEWAAFLLQAGEDMDKS